MTFSCLQHDVMLVSYVNAAKSTCHQTSPDWLVTGEDTVSTSLPHHFPQSTTENAQFPHRFPSYHPLCLINVWRDINRRKHRRQHDKPASHIKHIVSPEGSGLPQRANGCEPPPPAAHFTSCLSAEHESNSRWWNIESDTLTSSNKRSEKKCLCSVSTSWTTWILKPAIHK